MELDRSIREIAATLDQAEEAARESKCTIQDWYAEMRGRNEERESVMVKSLLKRQ
ncbi:unnamed protein product [Brassica oleracea]|uniref:(rape) hypothetical protein n=1 Tax=Brassica napus TaxID=3708 RepID=A0A816K1L8_BRANA|nr:unnamed protein product [Brassica napus]